MKMDETQFRKWYVEILEDLYQKEAGFPIMLIALPILERYLREETGIGENTLDDRFFNGLIGVFQEIKEINKAKQFWHTYRNGLLHQVTFSLRNMKNQTMPPSCIRFDQDEPVVYDENDRVSVNPILFAKKIVDKVLANYKCMNGSRSPNHPIPYTFSDEKHSQMGTASDDIWRK